MLIATDKGPASSASWLCALLQARHQLLPGYFSPAHWCDADFFRADKQNTLLA
jgi:hypothetical protein